MIGNFFKGIIIGIGKIIPGVSGSMLAISLGVYEQLLEIIADFKHITIKKFIFIFPIIFGILISISIFSHGIKWLLINHYFIIMLFFVGLILGGIPDLLKELKYKKIKIFDVIIFSISLILCYFFTTIGNIGNTIEGNLLSYFILGIIEAVSSIVPGISGTAIYLSLGAYDMLLDFFSNILNPENSIFCIFFGLGVLLGTIMTAKIITFLLKKYKIKTYYAILGFMTASIFLMISEAFANLKTPQINLYNVEKIIIGILLLWIGYYLNIKISKWLSN